MVATWAPGVRARYALDRDQRVPVCLWVTVRPAPAGRRHNRPLFHMELAPGWSLAGGDSAGDGVKGRTLPVEERCGGNGWNHNGETPSCLPPRSWLGGGGSGTYPHHAADAVPGLEGFDIPFVSARPGLWQANSQLRAGMKNSLLIPGWSKQQ